MVKVTSSCNLKKNCITFQSVADIQNTLEERKRKLSAFGLTFQPTPVAVGQNLETIDTAYVFIDDHLHQIPTLLKAVDLTFKIIHSQHFQYPFEAEQVWYLIQFALYELRTKWDKNFTAVSLLLADLKNYD